MDSNKLIYGILFIFIISCNSHDKKEVFPIKYNIKKQGKKEGLHFWKKDSFLIVTLFNNGLQNGGYTEINFKTGNVEYIRQFKNGYENGYIYDFYSSGVLKEFGEVKNDKKTNVGLEFHDKTMKLKVFKEYNQEGYVIYRKEKDTFGNTIKEEDYR